jgi:outer membrane cobalamin receptor
MKLSVFALVVLVLVAAPLQAQPSVILSGRVTDPSGSVVPGAVVEVAAGGRTVATTTTGPDGRYRLALAPGVRYEVRVRVTGFADDSIELTPAADITRDVVLQIAAIGDTLVVTASRILESRVRATESMTVITADEIAAMGAAQLADILRRTPGANVESTGREGAVASLFARGGESDYNHVLVDGVRVNANGGQFDFSRISAGEIDRVEVVRGAQSALYGSDAIGSVVQVFTKRAAAGDPPRLSGSFEGGSFATRRADLHLIGGAQNRVDYQLGAAYRGTDGAFSDLLPEDDRFDQTTVMGGAGTLLGDRATLRTGLRYSDARGRSVDPIVYGSRDTGTASDTEELSWHLDVTQQLTPAVTHAATVAYFRANRLSADRIADPSFNVFAILTGRPGALFPDSPRLVRLIDEQTFSAIRAGAQMLGQGQFLASTPFGVGDFPFTSEAALRRPAFKYQINTRWGDGQVLSGGYDFERERNPLASGFTVDNHAYFGQQQFTVRDRWFVTVGARVDDNSRYGTEFSPKASLGGFVRPFRNGVVSSIKVFANLGRGIKNPLFGELFGSAFSDGNPDLHPERARTFDAGAEVTLDSQRWFGRVAYFDNRFRDQVAFRSTGFGPDSRPDFLNIDGSNADGWELEAVLQRPLHGLTAGGAYSLVDTEVVSFVSTSEQFQPRQPLLRRPKHSGMLYASYVAGRAAVHVHARLVGERHDAAFLGLAAVPSPGSPVTTGRPVDITVNPAYTVIGIGGDYRIRDDLTVFVRVDNVTDEMYEGALGYPGLPRGAMAGARFVIGGR